MNEISDSIIAAVLAGGVSSVGTVIALRVHIDYLREGLKRVDGNSNRAHARIDQIEKEHN